MKNIKMAGILILVFSCLFCCLGCQTKLTPSEPVKRSKLPSDRQRIATLRDTAVRADNFTDPRDGETYAIVTIGNQVWMAENLRFHAPGSWLNPDNPLGAYGRLYDAMTAQTACPPGWHLPTDGEWNELEIALGMNPSDITTSNWRGEHGTKMKSTVGWNSDQTGTANGTNSSGFNAFPAGYCDPVNDKAVFEGLGYSVGYWAAAKDGISWQRWLGAPLVGVNRLPGDLSDKFASACRCLRD